MKQRILAPTEVEISYIEIELHVRYEEEDIPCDFPLRCGNLWRAKINIDSGQIEGWPSGKSGRVQMKVCDEGSYVLFGPEGNRVAAIEQDYVPHGVVPGEFGDYVDLQINSDGVITNWPSERDIDLSEFFKESA